MQGLDEYQQEVLRTTERSLDAYPSCLRAAFTALRDAHDPKSAEDLLKTFDQLIWCLGLAGEVGETLDMLKKHFGHGHALDVDKLKKEFGDVRWYGAALEHSFGLKSSAVAQANADKLRARYPQGFSVEASKAKADERPLVEKTIMATIAAPHDGTGAAPPVCNFDVDWYQCPELDPCELHGCSDEHCNCGAF